MAVLVVYTLSLPMVSGCIGFDQQKPAEYLDLDALDTVSYV